MLMGGGGSFSAGGPGKGMHSWLCKSLSVFVSFYSQFHLGLIISVYDDDDYKLNIS